MDWQPPEVNARWQPPEVAASQTQPVQSFGQTAADSLKQVLSAPVDAVKNLTPENTYRNLPMAGAIMGTAVAPGVGTAVGAGLGQIGSRMAGMAYGKEPLSTSQTPDISQPSTYLNKESMMPMVQTAVAGFPQTQGVQNFSQNMGRRALGITKGMIKELPGGVNQANQASQEMLNQGVIGPSTANTLQRAQDVAQTSGQAIGKTLAGAGQNALDTDALTVEIGKQLAPQYEGGAYDAQNNIVKEIIDTVQAHGQGPIDFQSAQTLKNTLKEMAGANWNTDNLKASMYQRAYGIVNQAIDNGLNSAAQSGTIPQSSVPNYLANKKTYGAAQMAIGGLRDKSAAEAANSILSLRGAAIGAGALASGHVTPALEALGVWELARRGGAGAIAPLLNQLYSQPGSTIGTATAQKVADYINQLYSK